MHWVSIGRTRRNNLHKYVWCNISTAKHGGTFVWFRSGDQLSRKAIQSVEEMHDLEYEEIILSWFSEFHPEITETSSLTLILWG